jgi:hypothetical protein
MKFPRLFKPKEPLIEIICVTYKQSGSLKVFVQSILNQTNSNWTLNVIHDGFDEEFEQLMSQYSSADTRIRYKCTQIRHNDWGHSLRDEGIQSLNGDYVLITNGDNYYVPVFIQNVTERILNNNPDVVMFDMIHSHEFPGGRNIPSYSYFKTEFSRCNIDMGAAVVKSSLARQTGFKDLTHDGDATYFEGIQALKGTNIRIEKIDKVLFVHN